MRIDEEEDRAAVGLRRAALRHGLAQSGDAAARYWSRSQPTSSSMVSRAWRSMNRVLAM